MWNDTSPPPYSAAFDDTQIRIKKARPPKIITCEPLSRGKNGMIGLAVDVSPAFGGTATSIRPTAREAEVIVKFSRYSQTEELSTYDTAQFARIQVLMLA
ncbi:unnamed protein product [Sympodiomycopsis kandeliae]